LVKEYSDEPRAPVEDAGEKKVVALGPVHVVPIDEELKALADFRRKYRRLDAFHRPSAASDPKIRMRHQAHGLPAQMTPDFTHLPQPEWCLAQSAALRRA
jgi:hypothetical protein